MHTWQRVHYPDCRHYFPLQTLHYYSASDYTYNLHSMYFYHTCHLHANYFIVISKHGKRIQVIGHNHESIVTATHVHAQAQRMWALPAVDDSVYVWRE